MIHSFGMSSRALAGALALLVAGTASASAQTASTAPAAMQTTVPAKMPQKMPGKMPGKMPPPGLLRLSDTITLRAGACWLVSDATDVEKPPEPRGPQRCIFRDLIPNTTVSVPANKDEFILFQYEIRPDGTIIGKGREGMNQGAYSCTITGKTRPGTKHGGLMKAGAVIRVMEIPSLP